MLVTLTFNLDKEKHGLLVNAIDVLQSNGDVNELSEETKFVVEDLTGYPCEKLFEKK